VSSDREGEVGREAAGTPAPFTQDEVAELVRGTLSEEAVAAVLEAFPAPPAGKRVRSVKQTPISLNESELRRLATENVTPAAVKKRLGAAARKDETKQPEPSDAGERPTKRPPLAGRGG
jgi:hypothetical protein